MAQAPKVKRIAAEDFASAPPWFNKFLDLFNQFANDTVTCLAGGLTFADNMNAKVVTISVNTGTPSASLYPIYLTNSLTTAPTVLLVGLAKTLKGNAPTSAVNVTWLIAPNGKIQINNFSGLAPNSQYSITLIYF